ncbi:MAG TPA: hypothetical protein VGR21_01135, partial [Cryptosporangiaceae bacterium]|nr:hypothetical protein [Cryptosporangiaceae bacterium]
MTPAGRGRAGRAVRTLLNTGRKFATGRRPGRRHPRRTSSGRSEPDTGAATIEFVFLGILVMVPLLYLVVAVFEVQRNAFAVTQA